MYFQVLIKFIMMKTKILYVLISSEEDYYFEQVLISVMSLKYHNPNAYVVLLVDIATNQRLSIMYKDRLELFDEIKPVQIDKNLSKMEKSRILKTSARKYIDGDFLFIDTDTVILGNISDIDNLRYDMAAVLDAHTYLNDNPYKGLITRHANKISNKAIYEQEKYYNSGVIYVKDNERTRKFYQIWNENWQKGQAKGVFMDQPSFAKTQNVLPIVKEIDGIWNCQLRHGLLYFNTCKILHYLCTNKSGNKYLYYFQNIEAYKVIREFGVERIEKKYYKNIWEGLIQTPVDIIVNKEALFQQERIVLFLKKHYMNNSILHRIIKRITSF